MNEVSSPQTRQSSSSAFEVVAAFEVMVALKEVVGLVFTLVVAAATFEVVVAEVASEVVALGEEGVKRANLRI